MDVLVRTGAALAPLAATAVLAWAVMSGPLSLGGGEKDIFLVLPVAVWAVFFALASLVMWARGASLARASRVAAVVASAVLLTLFAAFVVLTWR